MHKHIRTFVAAVALLTTSLTIGCSHSQPLAAPDAPPLGVRDGSPRNVIFFISDGCGPASFTMARDFAREELGRNQVFDGIQTGSVITRSSDSRVTDSAASGTAYACGIHTKNGRISVDDDGRPVVTVLERVEAAGYWTGLVSTARITHATPAVFASHVIDRGDETEIAAQELTKGVEVLLGGGLPHFLPRDAGGERDDGRNLIDEARAAGYEFVDDAASLAAAETLPILGLFNDSHMMYEIDRGTGNEPSLADMTRKTLSLLSAAPNGFFVMIEAGRIDHAAHDGDPATHLRDILAYDEAMRVAMDFARADSTTLILATSDHETGGLTVGRDGIYNWNPAALTSIRRSREAMLPDLRAALSAASTVEASVEAVTSLAVAAGMDPFSAEELVRIRDVVTANPDRSSQIAMAVAETLQDIISIRATLGWSSSGHTAVDVPLYAWGPGSANFVGRMENRELGRRLAGVLGVGVPLERLDP